MPSSDVWMDRNVSTFVLITPLGLVILFIGGWHAEDQDEVRNRVQVKNKGYEGAIRAYNRVPGVHSMPLRSGMRC